MTPLASILDRGVRAEKESAPKQQIDRHKMIGKELDKFFEVFSSDPKKAWDEYGSEGAKLLWNLYSEDWLQ